MNKVQLKKFIKMASENVAEGVKHVQERLQAACEKRPEVIQIILYVIATLYNLCCHI